MGESDLLEPQETVQLVQILLALSQLPLALVQGIFDGRIDPHHQLGGGAAGRAGETGLDSLRRQDPASGDGARALGPALVDRDHTPAAHEGVVDVPAYHQILSGVHGGVLDEFGGDRRL